MIIARKVNHCDITDRKYATPVDGGAFLAQGATGRWCEVMWVGPEEIKRQGYELMTYEQAVAKIGDNGYIDF